MNDNVDQDICQRQDCSEEVTAEFEYFSDHVGRILCFGYCNKHVRSMFQSCKDVGCTPKMRPAIKEKVTFT